MREVEIRIQTARRAQADWQALGVVERLRVIRRFREILSLRNGELSHRMAGAQGRVAAEVVVAEFIPLIDACRFLERRAAALLKATKLGNSGRPMWMAFLKSTIAREPFGVVLVLGPYNYPLMLPGIQVLQALSAGNAVVLKPGRGGGVAADMFGEIMTEARLPAGVLQILDDSVETAIAAVDAGADKVVVTGSVETGRSIAHSLAAVPTPATMELSGNDAVVILPGADHKIAARAVAYGLRLNASQTCIAPRRVIMVRAEAGGFRQALHDAVAGIPPLDLPDAQKDKLEQTIEQARAAGAVITPDDDDPDDHVLPRVIDGLAPDSPLLRADLFAPVTMLLDADDIDQALDLVHRSPYRLGASVFGSSDAARDVAARIDAGVVCINDAIVPTADPRVPFAGRGLSGYGTTRGADGLLEMTRPKAIMERSGKIRPHFTPPREDDEAFFGNFLIAVHGRGFATRWAAMRQLMTLVRARMTTLFE